MSLAQCFIHRQDFPINRLSHMVYPVGTRRIVFASTCCDSLVCHAQVGHVAALVGTRNVRSVFAHEIEQKQNQELT